MTDNNYLETIADEYGDIDRQIKALDERKQALRDELLTYVRDVPVVGLRWTVSKSESASNSLDTKAVRAFLGDKVREFERRSTVSKILVKPTKVLGQTAGDAP